MCIAYVPVGGAHWRMFVCISVMWTRIQYCGRRFSIAHVPVGRAHWRMFVCISVLWTKIQHCSCSCGRGSLEDVCVHFCTVDKDSVLLMFLWVGLTGGCSIIAMLLKLLLDNHVRTILECYCEPWVGAQRFYE